MSAGRIEPRAFARVGGLLLWSLGFNSPVAVADGFMALTGVAAETGVVLLSCLDNATREMRARSASDGRQEVGANGAGLWSHDERQNPWRRAECSRHWLSECAPNVVGEL